MYKESPVRYKKHIETFISNLKENLYERKMVMIKVNSLEQSEDNFNKILGIIAKLKLLDDKLFYLYLLTNPKTTQIGVYKITKKEMVFGLGFNIESINSLICRFIEHHKLIKYDEVIRELAIKNWGKYNLNKGGKPIIDCITKEFKEVQNIELVKYVAESIRNENIKNIYYNFIKSSVKSLKSHNMLDNTRYDTYHAA